RAGACQLRSCATTMGMLVVGLHHAGVHVSDLARSIAFYEGVFGLRLGARLWFGGEQLAFVRVGDAWLELIYDGTGRRQTGVVDHVSLEVNDLAGLMHRLVERGVTLLDQSPVPVAALGARILFCLGPAGERRELFE